MISTTYPSVRLGEVAHFVRGITFKPADVVPADTPGTVECMRTKNVQAELDRTDVWAVDANLVRRKDQFLVTGDTIVSNANSWNLVGKCCWIPELTRQTSFGGFISVLRADGQQVDSRYLYRWFSSDRIQRTVRSLARQTTNIANLDIKRCLDLTFPLPSLPEQRRVVDVLDRADTLRAKRHEAITRLDELAEAIFLDMFGDPVTNPLGWQRCSLGAILSSDGIQNGLYKPSSDYGAGSQIVRIDSFYGGLITELESLKRVRVRAEELARYQLAVGDILINRVNSREYLGKSAIVPDLREPTVFESNMMRLRVDERIADSRFVVYSLQSAFVKSQILSFAKDAVNQSSINQADVSAIVISLPPLDRQYRFVQWLDLIERQRASCRRQVVQLNSFFEGLQYRAFRGEL